MLEVFEGKLKSNPKDAYLLRWVGISYFSLGNIDTAEFIYKEAISRDSNCTKCMLSLAQVYASRRQTSKAVNLVNEALKKNPKDASLYRYRASLRQNNGDNYGATMDYDKAIELDPNNAEYYFLRGLFKIERGFRFSGLNDLDKAIELAPNRYYFVFQRSMLHYDEYRYEAALKDANRAIAIDSTKADVHSGKGVILHAMGENEAALDAFKKATEIDKDGYYPYLKSADIYYQLENMEGSCKSLFEVKRLINEGKVADPAVNKQVSDALFDFCDSSDAGYYYQRGISKYNLDQYEAAIKIYDRGLERFPSHPLLLQFKANSMLALGKYDEARSLYLEILNNREALRNSILKARRFKGYSEADKLTYYRGSIAGMHMSVAETYLYQDDVKEAVQYSDSSVQSAPVNQDYDRSGHLAVQGAAYIAAGQYDKALESLNKANEINSNFAMVYNLLAIAYVGKTSSIKFEEIHFYRNAEDEFIIDWKLSSKDELIPNDENLSKAYDMLRRSISISPTFPQGYYLRASLDKLSGRNYCPEFERAKSYDYPVSRYWINDCK